MLLQETICQQEVTSGPTDVESYSRFGNPRIDNDCSKTPSRTQNIQHWITVHVDDRCRPALRAEKVCLAFVCSPESVPASTWLTACSVTFQSNQASWLRPREAVLREPVRDALSGPPLDECHAAFAGPELGLLAPYFLDFRCCSVSI